jgi:hypothetical protein
MKELIEKLKNAFGEEHVRACLTSTTDALFFVFDTAEGGKSEIALTADDEDKVFKVHNPSQKEVYFLAIDEGLIPTENYKGKRPDFALFSEKKVCLVELKANMTSYKKVKRNIKQALEEQIIPVLNYLKDEGINFSDYDFEVYVVIPSDLYRKGMRAPAEANLRAIQFDEDYGGRFFEDKNETEF